METQTNTQFQQAPLKDRMVVYIGVAIVLLISWFYILGMGWHMNTLPFIENTSMNMDMDKSMGMESGIIESVLTWMPPSNGLWAMSDFILLFLMWSVMMVAMMTPSILPMLFLFTTLNSRNRMNGKETSSVMILLFGYLSSWILFSLVITFPEYVMHQTGLLNPMMEPTHAYIGSIVLCLAGIYQFTPFKEAL